MMKFLTTLLLLSSSAVTTTTTTAASSNDVKRHRQLQDTHKEQSSPPTVTPDRLIPNAINEDGNACSCSPIKFTFRLALSQDCTTDDIDENAGIDSTFCLVEEVADADSSNNGSNDEPIRKRRRMQSNDVTDIMIPVEITSVQYLEFAPGTLEVMHTDDTYVDTSLVDGDTVTFYSSSSYLPTVPQSQQEDYVPGGVSLILTGKTEEGIEVRNRFYWLYDQVVTDCLENLEVTGIYEGDGIGWVVTDEIGGPWPEFCPAESPTSPTITPRTLSPTSAPSSSPSEDDDAPTNDDTSSKSGKDEYSKSGKSSSKSSKNDVSSKSSKNYVEIDAKAAYKPSSKSSKSYSDTSSSSMSASETPSYSPSSLDSQSNNHVYSTTKSSKNDNDPKSGKHEYRVFSNKSSKGSTEYAFSKSGKSQHHASKAMSYSISMSSSAPSESSSPTAHVYSSESASKVVDAKAEKYSAKAYKLMPKAGKSNSGKSSKKTISMSFSMPSVSPAPTIEHQYKVTVYHDKSGKSRELMSEEKAGDIKSASRHYSSKSIGGKSSKSLSDMQSMSMPSSAPSESTSPTVVAYSINGKSGKDEVDAKSSKSHDSTGGKSSKSDHESYMESMSMPSSAPSDSTSPTMLDSKSGKGEADTKSSKSDHSYNSKSSKSYHVSEMDSMSMPSAAPSESTNPTAFDFTFDKSGKGELDAKAKKHYTSKSQQSGSSKSSKSDHELDVESMSMPSVAPSESTSPTKPDSSISKSGKGELDAKAHKNYSSKSVGSKSRKSDHESDVESMSMPSAAPSDSVAPTMLDSKSIKSGKGESDAKAQKHFYSSKSQRSASSKSSKSEHESNTESMSMPSAAPSESTSPTMFDNTPGKSGKVEVDPKAHKHSSSKTVGSKSSKSDHLSDVNMESMSMPSAAPSESPSPTEEMLIDTKAQKYSAKAYRLMKPKHGKQEVPSKSGKGSSPTNSDTSHHSITPSMAPSIPQYPSKSSKSEGKASESEMSDASMSYSMSIEYQEENYSSKSSKSDNNRGLRAERAAIDSVDW
eukprot:scaffold103135_cov71-Cyclotella_meneghiniana.AAC.6